MPRSLIVLAGLCLAGSAFAAPVGRDTAPPTDPVTRAHLLHAAQRYAAQIWQLIDTVHTSYVRPIPRADLATAALTGLFETQRLPVPKNLAARLMEADEKGQLIQAIIDTRIQLGNAAALDEQQALLASTHAVVRTLDPYCSVLTGEQERRSSNDEFRYGVGLELRENPGAGPLLLATVTPGGPAQRAGLRPGDHITHVNGKAVRGMASTAVNALIVGGDVVEEIPGIAVGANVSQLELTVLTQGKGEPRSLTLIRELVREETVFGMQREDDNRWNFWVEPKQRIAHIRLGRISSSSDEELAVVVDGLVAAGLRGLILDLRWCPGGYLNPAIDVASLFLEDGMVAKVESRPDREQAFPVSSKTPKYLGFPIVVLVGPETSGGGELIAAALKDHNRAIIAGERTRGKASVQSQVYVAIPDTVLRLTTGTFFRPSGNNLHRFPDSKLIDDWGVLPDKEWERRITPALRNLLRERWAEQTLRPGTSPHILRMDDPEADPQRYAVLKKLQRLLASKK